MPSGDDHYTRPNGRARRDEQLVATMTGDDSDPGTNGDLDPVGPSATPTDPVADGSAHVYHLDPDEPPCVAVVSAVAAVDGQEPIAMAPLHGAVDSDALDRLVSGPGAGRGLDRFRVTFEYLGYTVTIDPPDRVVVSE